MSQPLPPDNVTLEIDMADVKLSFNASPSTGVTSYRVQWTINGAAGGSALIPTSSVGDTSGYSRNFSADNGHVLVANDVVGVSVSAVGSGGLSSTPVVPASVTISGSPPPTAPLPPQNVTLAQV